MLNPIIKIPTTVDLLVDDIEDNLLLIYLLIY